MPLYTLSWPPARPHARPLAHTQRAFSARPTNAPRVPRRGRYLTDRKRRMLSSPDSGCIATCAASSWPRDFFHLSESAQNWALVNAGEDQFQFQPVSVAGLAIGGIEYTCWQSRTPTIRTPRWGK